MSFQKCLPDIGDVGGKHSSEKWFNILPNFIFDSRIKTLASEKYEYNLFECVCLPNIPGPQRAMAFSGSIIFYVNVKLKNLKLKLAKIKI